METVSNILRSFCSAQNTPQGCDLTQRENILIQFPILYGGSSKSTFLYFSHLLWTMFYYGVFTLGDLKNVHGVP